MKEPINMSEWTLERIQAEQDKHITPYAINPVDKKRLFESIDKDDTVVDDINGLIISYMRKVQEQSDMYRICEIAKWYIESQRPAEWIMNKTSARGRNYTCTACEKVSRNKFHYCPNCGRRMKYGT